MRIAVLDADPEFARRLGDRLRGASAECLELSSPPSPAELTAMRAQAVVLDPLALRADPRHYLEGVCGQLPHVGVLVCAWPCSVAERVRALRLGVDDWVTKPCHLEELVARLQAVTRRRRPMPAREATGPLNVGEIEIRPERFQAYVDGVSAELTSREFELLELLAAAGGAVLQREEIYARVWGYTMSSGDRSVDVFVRRLRKKLELVAPDRRYIHTHFGIGYRLAASPAPTDAAAGREPALVAS